MAARYSAIDIANWIVAGIDRDAGEAITHLKLQKLVYYAQAWSLVLRGEPLFDEDFQAWAHGPVAESVFHAFKDCGWNAIGRPEKVPDLEAGDEAHLREVIDAYGDMSAKQLERMTHAELPWLQARGDLPPEARSSAIIDKALMAEFYGSIYADTADGEK